MNNLTDLSHASATYASRFGGEAAGRADRLIRRATTGTVLFLSGVAGVVSYGHIHLLVVRYGEEPWTAALLPLSVDGMIVAASLTLLWDSRRGKSGGILAWALLIVASCASLAANVAVFHPMIISRVIAAWPSFALSRSQRATGPADPRNRQSSSPPDARPALDSRTAALLPAAQAARDELHHDGLPLTRDTLAARLRQHGHPIRNASITPLLRHLRHEQPTHLAA